MTRSTRQYWLAAGLFAAVCGMAVPASAQARGGMTWSGDVDDTTIVSVHGGDVQTDTVRGKDAANVNEHMFGRLPHRPIFVYLRHRDGRGQIRIVQQPSPDNGFTARVRIHDSQAGRSHYAFDLGWSPLTPPNAPGFDRGGRHGF